MASYKRILSKGHLITLEEEMGKNFTGKNSKFHAKISFQVSSISE